MSSFCVRFLSILYTANGLKNEVHYHPFRLQPILLYLQFATSPTKHFCIQLMMCQLAVHPKETWIQYSRRHKLNTKDKIVSEQYQHGYQFAGCRGGTVVGAFACHQCVRGSIPARCHMWVEFLCWFSSLLRGVFSGFSGFPPSTKTKTKALQIPIRPG